MANKGLEYKRNVILYNGQKIKNKFAKRVDKGGVNWYYI